MKLEDTTLELEPEFVSVGSRILISPDIMSIVAARGRHISMGKKCSVWKNKTILSALYRIPAEG